MINKNKIDYTDGTIVGANTAVPETMKKNNSKWAIVSYKVDGKMITSENKIQVSMNSKVGDKVKIAYLINNPEKLFTATFKKAFISFIIALISFIVAHYIK
jgi:endo-beta-N-acetylglucosaminidase D